MFARRSRAAQVSLTQRPLPLLLLLLLLATAALPLAAAAPVPVFSLPTSLQGTAPLGPPLAATLAMVNSGPPGSPGYQPFMDMLLPPGLTVTSGAYLGIPLAVVDVRLAPCGEHPFGRTSAGVPELVCSPPPPADYDGEEDYVYTLYTARLPLSSVPPSMPIQAAEYVPFLSAPRRFLSRASTPQRPP